MRKRVPDEATCPICGRYFDPSETRGWCPNPSCGEWQHPSFPLGDDSTEEAATPEPQQSPPSTPMKPCPNCGKEVRAEANFCKHCATQLSDSGPPESQSEPAETDEDDAVIADCPDCGADLSQIPSDRLSTCPICMFDLAPLLEDDEATPEPQTEAADSDTGAGDAAEVGTATQTSTETESEPEPQHSAEPEPQSETAEQAPNSTETAGEVTDSSRTASESDTAALTSCPNCGEDLTPIPPELRTVCPGCRVDLDEGLEAGTGPEDATPPEQPAVAVDEPAHGSDSTPLTSVDDIADGYVTRLSEIGITTAEELAGEDADAVSAKTGISARRIRNWVDSAPVDADTAETGATAGVDETANVTESTEASASEEVTDAGADEVDFQATRIQRSPDELVLEVMGQEIVVTEATTVGGEVRNAMVEAGAPEEDAVYVHRKHIRIDVDDGFLLTRLGENSLAVNGSVVEKGEQVPIENGDEIVFSDVVTATVTVR